MQFDDKEIKRFQSLVFPEPMSGCHIWLGAVNPHGYGRFGVKNPITNKWITIQAHRYSYMLANNVILESKQQVQHKPIICHNPTCVSRHHLKLGDHKENYADMLLDNTVRKSRFSDEFMDYLRTRKISGVSYDELVMETGLKKETIKFIVCRLAPAYDRGKVYYISEHNNRYVSDEFLDSIRKEKMAGMKYDEISKRDGIPKTTLMKMVKRTLECYDRGKVFYTRPIGVNTKYSTELLDSVRLMKKSGCKTGEIIEKTGIPRGTLKSILYRYGKTYDRGNIFLQPPTLTEKDTHYDNH